MGESVAILFIFFILLMFGFVFYMRILGSSAKVDIEESIQLKAIAIAQKASFLPEMQCSQENVRIENCIDRIKLEFMEELTSKNKPYYYDLFGFSSIKVVLVSPNTGEFLVYNNTPEKYLDKLSTFIPTSLYDPETGSYQFAILVVEVFK